MKQLATLVWKEWFEVRIFLAIGLFIFLGLPLIGALELLVSDGKWWGPSTTIWTLFLGGVLAVFVAVGIVVRDMNGRLEEFWRSRPVSVVRWVLVKYAMGLAIIMGILILAMVAEILFARGPLLGGDNQVFAVLAWHPFLWAAIYSISFAIACLIRRGAHAAMLSIAALLLLYFLPSVLPPISFLSVTKVTDQSQFPVHDRDGKLVPGYHQVPWMPWSVVYEPQQMSFAAGMLVLCGIGLVVSVLAAKRDWRIESDRKIIYWSIGGAVLVLFASAAFQVATNLPVICQVDRPIERISMIRCDGTNGFMAVRTIVKRSDGIWEFDLEKVRSLHLSGSAIEIGPAVPAPSYMWGGYAWQPEAPDAIYSFETIGEEECFPRLITTRLGQGELGQIDLEDLKVPAKEYWSPRLFAFKDRLYMMEFSKQLVTFDITDPFVPRRIATETFDWIPSFRNPNESTIFKDYLSEPESITFTLPPIKGLEARQRLGIATAETWQMCLDGDVLVLPGRQRLLTYQLEKLTDVSATFRKLGRYEPSQVEQLFGGQYSWGYAAANGLFYQVGQNGQIAFSDLTVFDIVSARPHPVGHFSFRAAQELNLVCPLPGGRVIASDSKHLYILGPPPGYK